MHAVGKSNIDKSGVIVANCGDGGNSHARHTLVANTILHDLYSHTEN